jgi:hypothetical protein
MDPTSQQAGQDAAVAVLQAQQKTLDASLQSLNVAVREGFATMAARMERLGDIALSIERINADQRAHSDGLQRAFGEIRGLRESIETRNAEEERLRTELARDIDDRFAVQASARLQYQEEHARVHAALDSKVTFAKGVLVGAGFLYTALVSLLVWAASTYIGETRENTKKLHQLELENARHHTARTP